MPWEASSSEIGARTRIAARSDVKNRTVIDCAGNRCIRLPLAFGVLAGARSLAQAGGFGRVLSSTATQRTTIAKSTTEPTAIPSSQCILVAEATAKCAPETKTNISPRTATNATSCRTAQRASFQRAFMVRSWGGDSIGDRRHVGVRRQEERRTRSAGAFEDELHAHGIVGQQRDRLRLQERCPLSTRGLEGQTCLLGQPGGSRRHADPDELID